MPVAHPTTTTTAGTDTIECTRCHTPMETVPSAHRGTDYWVCPRCRTRLASAYSEVLRAGAAARVKPAEPERPDPRSGADWSRIRDRAERWFARLDAQDPYRTLGLPPSADFPTVRARYHELAGRHHPDHGGDGTQMREVIDAYKQIRGRLARSSAALTVR